jgi:hypothetical protein
MAKGETVMPVPYGVISTSEGPVDPNLEPNLDLDAAIVAADAEEATEEYKEELVQDDLPELS